MNEKHLSEVRTAEDMRLMDELRELDSITFEIEDINEVGIFAGSGACSSSTCSTCSSCSSCSCCSTTSTCSCSC
jgi:hypothetical protein